MGLTNLLLMATGAAVLVFQPVSGQGTCGGVGGVGSVGGESTAKTRNKFYINAVSPAVCSGYINSFSFCYYRPYTLSGIRYVFSFALYRESSTSAGTYNSVSRTFVVERTLSDIQSELGSNTFICVNLTVSESVPVEAGDVLGACVYDPPGDSNSRLDIVSRGSDEDRIVLRASSSVCSPDAVPSTVTPVRSRNRFLNLQAEIVPPLEPPPTMETKTISQTTPPTMGTTTISETTPLITDATTVYMEMTGSSTNATGILTEIITIGVIAGSVAALSVILVISAAIVVLVVLLAKKSKLTKRDYSLPTPEISDGSAGELEYNTAYGVSRFEEAACYETIDSVNAMEPTLTKISDGPAVELESNTAYGVSRDMNSRQFEEAICYETVDSDMPVNTTLTRASSTGGVFTNLQGNEAYGVSSGVGQSVQGADDNEYWNVTGQDDCNEYEYI